MSHDPSGAASQLLAAGYSPIGCRPEPGPLTPEKIHDDGTTTPFIPMLQDATEADCARWDDAGYWIALDASRTPAIVVEPGANLEFFVPTPEGAPRLEYRQADGCRVFPFRGDGESLRVHVGDAALTVQREGLILVHAEGGTWCGDETILDVPPDRLPRLNSASIEHMVGRIESKHPEAQVARPVEDEDDTSYVDATDEQLAAEVKAGVQGELRHDRASDRWFVWDGARWNGGGMRDHFAPIRRECRRLSAEWQLKAAAAPSEPEQKAARKRAAQYESVHQQNAIATMLHRDLELGVLPTDFDTEPTDLNTPAGIIDLQTGALLKPDPAGMHSKVTAVAPASVANDTTCPRWLRFIDEVTRGDAELARFMQKISGYALTGMNNEHGINFIWGPGGNGKSVFLDTIMGVMGDYATTAALDTFTATRNEKHSTDLASLIGARLVAASETKPGEKWDEQRLKAVTGGDRMKARFMRQDFVEFTPQFTLLIAGNHEPHLERVDDAMRRRIRIIPFTFKPEEPDLLLPEKLKDEYPGILRWMIDGTQLWLAEGLAPPPAVQASTSEYLDAEDLPRQFIEKCCELDPDGEVTRAEAFEAWKRFCHAEGIHDTAAIGVLRDMKGRFRRLEDELGFEDALVGPGRAAGWKGIRLVQSGIALEVAR